MSRRARLRKLFAELRGLEEWGVRVITRNVEAELAQTVTSGRDYLQVKKRLSERGGAPSAPVRQGRERRIEGSREARVEGAKGFVPARQAEGGLMWQVRRFS